MLLILAPIYFDVGTRYCAPNLRFIISFLLKLLFLKLCDKCVRQDGREVGWTWSTSLSMDTSGIHLQTQNSRQNTSLERTGVPDQRKRIYRTTQNLAGQKNQGEEQECY